MQANSPWLTNGVVDLRHDENLASEVLARTCQLGDGVRSPRAGWACPSKSPVSIFLVTWWYPPGLPQVVDRCMQTHRLERSWGNSDGPGFPGEGTTLPARGASIRHVRSGDWHPARCLGVK